MMLTWQRNHYPIHSENTDGSFENVRSYEGYPTLIDVGGHVFAITGDNTPIAVSSIDLLEVNMITKHHFSTSRTYIGPKSATSLRSGTYKAAVSVVDSWCGLTRNQIRWLVRSGCDYRKEDRIGIHGRY